MVEYPPGRIDGTRLLLRPPTVEDAGTIFQRVARDPEVTKYLLWTPHPDVPATRRVITEKLNISDDDRTWAITLRNSGDVIGMASCRRPLRHSVEIGYCMGRRWWGKGYMPEVVDMLLTTLQADRDVYRVWGTTHVDNERSVRVLQRAGFALEGRLVRHAIYPTIGPEPQDSLLYAKALR
jgi:[ribosomal protein S5]-alanine N-acetyltransferase